MTEDTVSLVLGNRAWSGWTRVEVERSMENLAGAFTLTVTERWPGVQATQGIAPGAPCKLMIGSDIVITGYVDDVKPDYDATRHEVVVNGRDAAGDLVDCQTLTGIVKLPSGTAISMIAAIAEPFGIKVSADVPEAQTQIADAEIQHAETAFETISRIAEQSGFLVVSDGQGGIRLTNAGAAGGQAALVLGKNIKSARGHFSMKDRFSLYEVTSQAVAFDFDDPVEATIGVGKATDPGVTRYRPLGIIADISSGGDEYRQKRAQWEAGVRLGRAMRADLTVQGWRDGAGTLWRPNTLARVVDPFLAIDATLLISGVKLRLDEDGSTATLTVTAKEAFTPAPVPLIKALGIGGGQPQ